MKKMPLPVHPLIGRRDSGAALVIVMAFLVMILGLAITFLARTSIERKASSSYVAGITTRQLADTAVNIVQTQIRSATTLGNNVAWSSQPGMIRTYGAGTAGNYTADSEGIFRYKLYSATNLVVDSTETNTADLPAATWETDKAVWTDLNQPVMSTKDGTAVAHFPILDPAALGKVEGFSATNAGGVTNIVSGDNTNRRIPMPVRWMYVTKDGSILAASGTGQTATVTGASKDNPIVGRIAFWTDDETCKVNINTASEGMFWDTPRVHGKDTNLAQYQPSQREFQRFPGHPAMTSLAPIFFATSSNSTPNPLTPAQRDALYALTPRIAKGGSDSGTKISSDSTKVTPDSDRLYANVDELAFTASRTLTDGAINSININRAKFFLTANSRAPELTLSGFPRVAIWPIDNDQSANYRTALDKLIAFCSTVNGKPYYFQRSNPKSSTEDANIPRNKELYAYLQAEMAQKIPGEADTSPTLAEKYPLDKDQILTEIVDYIRCVNLNDPLLDEQYRFGDRAEVTQVTGFKLGNGSVAPLQITTGGAETQGFGRFPTISELGIHLICSADGAGFKVAGAPIASSSVLTAAPYNVSSDTLAEAIRRANNSKLDSNVADNKTLGGTLLKGEAFLDVGYKLGATVVGAGNGKFDWSDDNADGDCNVEPWMDINQNGLYDAGEPFIDYADAKMPWATKVGEHDEEPHEPFLDTGRDNKFAVLDADQTQGKSSNPTSLTARTPIKWQSANASLVTSSTQAASYEFPWNMGNGVYDFSERRVEAMFFWESFIPAQGWPRVSPAYCVKVTGLDSIKLGGTAASGVSLGFPASAVDLNMRADGTHTRTWGGVNSHRMSLRSACLPARGVMPADESTASKVAGATDDTALYPFVSAPTTIPVYKKGTYTLGWGEIKVEVYPRTSVAAPGYDAAAKPTTVITIPAGNVKVALPALARDAAGDGTLAPYFWTFSRDGVGINNYNGASASDYATNASYESLDNYKKQGGRISLIGDTSPMSKTGKPDNNAQEPYATVAQPFRGDITEAADSAIGVQDVVRTWIPTTTTTTGAATHGDYRLVAASGGTPVTFELHPFGDKNDEASNYMAHSIMEGNRDGYIRGASLQGLSISNAVTGTYGASTAPDVPSYHENARMNGDWDNGIAGVADGPYINKPDEGNNYRAKPTDIPYYDTADQYTAIDQGMFSPNRQMPSAGVFGSLPTGVKSQAPFQTLLFRKQINATEDKSHIGGASSEDYRISDLFWMPAVEPYAISETLSTAGKINLNYRIVPFTYIRRATGMVAALRSEKMLVVPTADSVKYKTSASSSIDYRKPIDINETLEAFDEKSFRSTSTLCDMYLVPQGETQDTIEDFLSRNLVTGDNSRERTYANLLGRVTTKSNTYTVHYKVQALKKSSATAPDAWDEAVDNVTGEYRGSTTIERYISPNETTIPDYASVAAQLQNQPNLENYYKWRTISNRQFAP